MEETKKTIKESEVVVLDFLQNGYVNDKRPAHMKTPVVQGLGKTSLCLLELVPKKDICLQPHDVVYVGEGKRDQIHHINGRINIDKLSNTAEAELEYALKDLIKADETPFVEFFNKARPLSTRMHQLELLPGLGKKHMWEILDELRDKDFESFEDIKKRIHLMPDPAKLVYRRIISELKGKEKYHIFTN